MQPCIRCNINNNTIVCSECYSKLVRENDELYSQVVHLIRDINQLKQQLQQVHIKKEKRNKYRR